MHAVKENVELRPIRTRAKFSAPRAITALILRETITAYGRHFGGYLWAFLEPVGSILALAFLLSLGFRAPPLGENFAIFMATGFMPYFMFLETNNRVAHALRFSQQLLSFPRVTFLDAIVARFVLVTLTRAVVSFAILFVIVTLWKTNTVFEPGPVIMGFGLAACLGLGCGLANAILLLRFSFWGSIWNMVVRVLMLTSGVIFLIEDLPEPYATWLVWNPIAHLPALVRAGFYHGYEPAYGSAFYVMGFALVLGTPALLFLKAFHRELLEK